MVNEKYVRPQKAIVEKPTPGAERRLKVDGEQRRLGKVK